MTTVERFIFNLTRAKNDTQRCDAACQLKKLALYTFTVLTVFTVITVHDTVHVRDIL